MAFVERIALLRPLNHVVPNVVRVDDEFAKLCSPVQVLLFASKVELAAVTVIEPPSATFEPLIVTEAFWSWLFPIVEVATTEPFAFTARSVLARLVIANVVEVAFVNVVLAKALAPEKVLLFARSVEDAAVIVPELPREMPVPLTVTLEFCN